MQIYRYFKLLIRDMAPKFFGVFLGFMLICIVTVVGLLSYNEHNGDEKSSIMRVEGDGEYFKDS